MSEHARLSLLAALLFSASVHAESGLQGLEMDVMNPGENAARATSRIAIPRMSLPTPAEQDLPGIEAERNARADALSPSDAGLTAREATPAVETPDTLPGGATPPPR